MSNKALDNFNDALTAVKYSAADLMDTANNNAFSYDDMMEAFVHANSAQERFKQAYANLYRTGYPLPETVYADCFDKNEKFSESF